MARLVLLPVVVHPRMRAVAGRAVHRECPDAPAILRAGTIPPRDDAIPCHRSSRALRLVAAHRRALARLQAQIAVRVVPAPPCPRGDTQPCDRRNKADVYDVHKRQAAYRA